MSFIQQYHENLSEYHSEKSPLIRWVKARLGLVTMIGASLLLISGAAYWSLNVIQSENIRAHNIWQERLQYHAELKKQKIENWFEQQFVALNELSQNPSLKIFLSGISSDIAVENQLQPNVRSANSPENLPVNSSPLSLESVVSNLPAPQNDIDMRQMIRSGQRSFIKQMLNNKAISYGYHNDNNININANIERTGNNGIAIIDRTNKPIMATSNMPVINNEIQAFIARIYSSGKADYLDFFLQDGKINVAFAVPIYSVHSSGEKPSDIVGVAIGVKSVAAELLPIIEESNLNYLGSGLAGDNNIETIIISDYKNNQDASNNTKYYLDSEILESRASKTYLPAISSAANPNNIAALATSKPGMLIESVASNGEATWQYSIAIPNSNWYVAETIAKDQALSSFYQDVYRYLTQTGFAVAAVFLLFFAIWRHGASAKSQRDSRKYRELSEKYAKQQQLLRLIADRQQDNIFIVDQHMQYLFANSSFADSLLSEASQDKHIDPRELVGKSIAAVLGVAISTPYQKAIDEVLEHQQQKSYIHQNISYGDNNHDEIEFIESSKFDFKDVPAGRKWLKTKFIPLSAIPIGDNYPAGVLVIQNDISDIIHASNAQEKILQQLVNLVIDVIDRRSAYTARHSYAVSKLSEAVASELGIDRKTKHLAATAGIMMNLGKVCIDEDILSKSTSLSDEERKQLAQVSRLSAELLSNISFNIPIAEAIKQSTYYYDGSNIKQPESEQQNATNIPSGEDIMMAARIIAVINSFVAMISPRPWRSALPIEQAIIELQKEAGKKFDRKVVASLDNYIENNNGRELIYDLAPQMIEPLPNANIVSDNHNHPANISIA